MIELLSFNAGQRLTELHANISFISAVCDTNPDQSKTDVLVAFEARIYREKLSIHPFMNEKLS